MLAVVYGVLAWGLMPSHVFFSPDEGQRFVQVQSYVRARWRTAAMEYPGRELDPEGNYIPISAVQVGTSDEVRFYVRYPDLFTLLSSLFYALLGYRGLYVIPLLCGVGAAGVTYLLAREFDVQVAEWAIVLIGVCTPVWFYSLLLWDHVPSTFLPALATWLLILDREGKRFWAPLLGGLALGLSTWMRVESYLLAVAVGLAFLIAFPRAWRALILFVVGIALAVSPLWLIQQQFYGSMVGPRVEMHASAALPTGSRSIRLVLERVAEMTYLSLLAGYPHWLAALSVAVGNLGLWLILQVRRLRQRRWLLFGLVLALLASLPSIIYGKVLFVTGLLAVSPLAVFAMVYPGAEQSGRPRRDSIFLMLAILGYVAEICLATQIDPGWQWGTRFLLPVYPLLLVAALRAVEVIASSIEQRGTRRVVYVAFVGLAMISFFLQIEGLQLLLNIKRNHAALLDFLASLPAQQVVAEVHWYAPHMSSLFYEREFFLARTQQNFEGIVQLLYQGGVRQFVWASRVDSPIDPLVRMPGYEVRERSKALYEIVPLSDEGR
jgi:hypothetical protein